MAGRARAKRFKGVDWKTGKVAVKMPVTLEMRVLISVHSLQALGKNLGRGTKRDEGRKAVCGG